MTLLWIANIVFLVVIVPVVVLVLQRLIRPAFQIGNLADQIDKDVSLFPGHIQKIVGELATTQQLATVARPEIQRYANAVTRLL